MKNLPFTIVSDLWFVWYVQRFKVSGTFPRTRSRTSPWTLLRQAGTCPFEYHDVTSDSLGTDIYSLKLVLSNVIVLGRAM